MALNGFVFVDLFHRQDDYDQQEEDNILSLPDLTQSGVVWTGICLSGNWKEWKEVLGMLNVFNG